MLNRTDLLVVTLAGVSLAGISGCKHADETAKAARSSVTNPLKVQVDAELLRQIMVGNPQVQEVTTQEKVAARVETDASRVARIGSPVDGRITQVVVYEGQRVKQGQVLAMLHSNALSDTQFAFLKAFTQERLAQQSAELQKREAEVRQTDAEVAALRAQLRGLGMSDHAIQQLETTKKLNSDYPIIASISGTVIERKVTVGQVLQPADLAFQIADLSSLWFVADVPEEQARSLYLGKNVTATIPAVADKTVSGKLTFVSPVVNPQTRTVQARMILPNPEGLFKPEMLASMIFESRPERALTIPSTAVVREDNKDHVFVQTSESDFILREVELGDEVSDRRVVQKGLIPSETIVLDGAFHLNNKRRQDQIKGAE